MIMWMKKGRRGTTRRTQMMKQKKMTMWGRRIKIELVVIRRQI